MRIRPLTWSHHPLHTRAIAKTRLVLQALADAQLLAFSERAFEGRVVFNIEPSSEADARLTSNLLRVSHP